MKRNILLVVGLLAAAVAVVAAQQEPSKKVTAIEAHGNSIAIGGDVEGGCITTGGKGDVRINIGPSDRVSASNGGIAIGGSVNNATITVGSPGQRPGCK